MEDWLSTDWGDDLSDFLFEDHHSGGQMTNQLIMDGTTDVFSAAGSSGVQAEDNNGPDFCASTYQSSQNHVTNQNSGNQLITYGTTNVFSAAGSSGVQAEVLASDVDTSILVRTNHDGLGSGVEAEGRTIRMAGNETRQNQSVLRAQDSVHIGTRNDVEPAMDILDKKKRKVMQDREYRARIKQNKIRLQKELDVKLQEHATLQQKLQSANTYILQLLEKIQKLEQDLQASFHQNDLLSEKLVAANTMIEQLERNCQDFSQTLADRKKAEEEVLVKLQSANTTIEKLNLRLKGQQSVSQQPVRAVLGLNIKDDRGKQKVMEIVASFPGTDSIAISIAENKLTIIGDVDPVDIVRKLRKVCDTHILSVGPAKEEKKDAGKKPEKMKPCETTKLDDHKKNDSAVFGELVRSYKAYNPYTVQYYSPYYYSIEENPNSCVIC